MRNLLTTLARSPTVTRTPLIIPVLALTSLSLAASAWHKQEFIENILNDEKGRNACIFDTKTSYTLWIGAMYGIISRSQFLIKQPSNFALSSLYYVLHYQAVRFMDPCYTFVKSRLCIYGYSCSIYTLGCDLNVVWYSYLSVT